MADTKIYHTKYLSHESGDEFAALAMTLGPSTPLGVTEWQ